MKAKLSEDKISVNNRLVQPTVGRPRKLADAGTIAMA